MKKVVFLLASMVVLCGGVQAKEITFGIQPGIPFNLGGGFDRWKSGFGVGGNFFFGLSDRVAIGVQATYNYVSPNPDSFVGFYDLGQRFTSIDILEGSGSDVSLLVALRYYLGAPAGKARFFIQAGGCFDLMKVTINKIGGSVTFSNWVGSGTAYAITTYPNGRNFTRNAFGISVGPGLSLAVAKAIRLEIIPKLSLLMTEGGATTVFTLSGGISLAKKL
jgi:hypothetical protein